MKAVLSKALEENAELEIENKHLREHLQELQDQTTEETDTKDLSQGLSKSKQNLQNLYEEGFISVLFMVRDVKRRTMPFCNDVIYGERTAD